AVQVESRAAVGRMRDLGAAAVYDSLAGPTGLGEALRRLLPDQESPVAA
ncbi:MAG: hypothetical protein JWL64_1472, partial [Frankiales bacterium]|nr:hypothetical protein [Frankiales bacterium]